ncbi:hypothetical protein M404DRAFT_857373 [Pisolithus tinctorius Marx 270]|uniref:Uncharacterized protein n=1 Tax=Pisolithus tinctorius Marx 270 TaxID=870435 RepID=A0A0C3NS86_PISTI|nr:hypothetical protein M404DRAFT_857373 [Pisolithus tinctorius Marx 270]
MVTVTPEELGIDPEDPDLRPVVHEIGSERSSNITGGDVPTIFISSNGQRTFQADPALVLRAPVGLSLPNTRSAVSLLKALSTRAANCCLVTMVVQCSAAFATNTSEEKPKTGILQFPSWRNRCKFSESCDSHVRNYLPH